MFPMPGNELVPWRWKRQILATRPHGNTWTPWISKLRFGKFPPFKRFIHNKLSNLIREILKMRNIRNIFVRKLVDFYDALKYKLNVFPIYSIYEHTMFGTIFEYIWSNK